MKTIKKLVLKEEEKELLHKAANLIWDIGEIDSENDIAENILGLNISSMNVTTFEDLGNLIALIADCTEDE